MRAERSEAVRFPSERSERGGRNLIDFAVHTSWSPPKPHQDSGHQNCTHFMNPDHPPKPPQDSGPQLGLSHHAKYRNPSEDSWGGMGGWASRKKFHFTHFEERRGGFTQQLQIRQLQLLATSDHNNFSSDSMQSRRTN